jgi:hypothetical protein
MEAGASHVEVTTVGRPPALTIAWSSASVEGSLLTERVAPHRLLAISQALPRLWPPGPYAIGAATATVVEALIHNSRRLLPALRIIDGDLGARGRAVMLPLQLGQLRVLSHTVPSLSPQERTDLMNAISGG